MPLSPREAKRFDRSAEDLMNQQIHVQRIFAFLFPVIFLVANLGQAAVLYFGGIQIINGTLTLGEWQKFSLYLVLVFFPIGQLGFIITQMSQAAASANRVYEILDATHGRPTPPFDRSSRDPSHSGENRASACECAAPFDFYPLSDYTHRSQHSERGALFFAVAAWV